MAADPDQFAMLVEAKGTPAVAKLQQMAAAVNDMTQDINDVIAKYFNRANYVTWLAVNMLMTNYDTNTQNFILYSPSGYAGWYFLPWDYDGGLGLVQPADRVHPAPLPPGALQLVVGPAAFAVPRRPQQPRGGRRAHQGARRRPSTTARPPR